ncbi:cell envelope-related function transcriptional attenuator common domain-containing protein [Blastococcus sp. DSM 46786]|uniref:LCP family protein n=1 Tax=Blastococcus sp. DSM 46786 TaxID=1798227 RepID=UPI0008BA070D|nr:LCP family protein [Blastococcus sp. DSM 46786]SEL64232.1 cell envelope-related function transcriptional attenuator common domain-containing protein [Blastococcus sp. DSM 46786]
MRSDENGASGHGTGDAGRVRDTAPIPLLPASADGAEEAQPRRRGLRRVLISLGVLALVLAVLVGGGMWFLADRWGGNIDRVSGVFADLEAEARPAPATPQQSAGEDPVTFLLVGSDTRSEGGQGADPGGRSDAIMLARLSADRQHAQLISIPRDSWVEIPGHGMNKINASYALGGPSLLVQTVEQLTQVRIDHYVAIDFEGLVQVTDDLGGVDVVVAETTRNGPYTFTAGVNHLNGDEARWYLAQRYGLTGGDFDRVKRQQQYLRAMFDKLFSAETFTSPPKLDAAMLAVTSAVSVDETLSNADLVSLAYSMRGVTPGDIEYFTAPVLGTGMEGPASVVYLDHVTAERMWEYLRSDSLAQNADEFADEALPDVPR